MLLVKDSNVIF